MQTGPLLESLWASPFLYPHQKRRAFHDKNDLRRTWVAAGKAIPVIIGLTLIGAARCCSGFGSRGDTCPMHGSSSGF